MTLAVDPALPESAATLPLASPGYPALLASIHDPPSPLYVRGSLPEIHAIAIVGSRRPTPYGRRIARRLASEAAAAGFAVVSGLARGIDTEAHRAALEAGGRTWAVLGSGLGHLYPPENRGLAEQIVRSGGAVLSEFPEDVRPTAFTFPRRNRIISGLSWVTIVVEGNEKSGALITARCALEQGREVGAVPGPVDSEMSEGPLRLLRDGASPIARFQDVLQMFPPDAAPGGLTEKGSSAIKEAQSSSCCYKEATSVAREKILKSLGSEAVSLETILQEAGLDVPAALRILAELEIQGLVESLPGQSYARR